MVRFKMVARDVDSFPIQFRTWITDDQPDLTGELYTGDKSGPNPLMDISAYIIYDDTVVADFNLPNPLSWETTKRVLPSSLAYSHLAIVDDYIYLFGGQITDKIYRASVNTPAEWKDTGSVLPSKLYDGQLAVIDDRIYIFGGNDGYSVDTIFSAPTSDPLTWTNHGHLLPRRLHGSQLAILDGYIYLFGGIEINHGTDVIFKASAADPLTWEDTGAKIPTPLYNSQIAVIGDYTYLFGGQLHFDSVVDLIFRAPNSNPLAWLPYSILPYAMCGGQFFTVGSNGYLISPTSKTTAPRQSFTKILRCDLATPGQWVDTKKFVPGEVSQSKLAIIYDRLFLFGGNGTTVIYANNQELKYKFGAKAVVDYGDITRIRYNITPNKLDLFKVIGFPPWKTDYGS